MKAQEIFVLTEASASGMLRKYASSYSKSKKPVTTVYNVGGDVYAVYVTDGADFFMFKMSAGKFSKPKSLNRSQMIKMISEHEMTGARKVDVRPFYSKYWMQITSGITAAAVVGSFLPVISTAILLAVMGSVDAVSNPVDSGSSFFVRDKDFGTPPEGEVDISKQSRFYTDTPLGDVPMDQVTNPF